MKIILGIVLTACTCPYLSAQPVPVDDYRHNQFRTLQLLSDSALTSSLVNLPLWRTTYEQMTESSPTQTWWESSPNTLQYPLSGSMTAGIYDPTYTLNYNSQLPRSGNNGAAWYGRGLNTEFRGGFWITSPYLTVTFRPHIVYQQNRNFEAVRFVEYRRIDLPGRFGTDSFSTYDWGETGIHLHYKSMEAGLSNQSLWWGPAVHYPLVMSNNAPGLKHAFLGTRTPLSLPANIGNLEFRWIWALPENSEHFDPSGTRPDRFMNGINIAWSPSFIPNLAVGLTRVFHQYIPDDGLTLADYTSIILPFQKSGLANEGNQGRNQLASVYFRWVFPGSDAEIYGEYFKEDHNYDLRDFLMQPDHNRAYNLGMQKIFRSDWIDFFKVNLELTSLAPNRIDEVRPQIHYYTHAAVSQGHTNRGQVLGAAIGPGSGSQYLDVEGYFRDGQMGVFLQRVERNDFFHYEYYDQTIVNSGYKDVWRNWIELNMGLKGRYRTGPLLLSGSLVWNRHLNYGRFGYGDLDVDFDTFEGQDLTNWQLQITAQYFLQ